MATVMHMQWKGVTAEQYQAVCERMDWDGAGERGLIAHVAGVHDGALHVTDVWESGEQFQRFLGDTIQPLTQELGIGDGQPPDVQMYEAIRGWSRERATA